MIIPLTKPYIDSFEIEQVSEVLRSGWLTQGPKVEEFERKIAEYCHAKHAVATSSCTAALFVALQALGIKEGSEIIVPDFTFPATANVAGMIGAKPVIVDVSRETYAIDPSEVKHAISTKTSCIILVDPFGQPALKDEIYEIASKHGIEVIEDSATSLGAEYKGKRVGSNGRAVCFSFHPRKIITTGEGGCLVTNDEEVAERARMFRNHGQKYYPQGHGFYVQALNFRMSDINAALGIAQLSRLDGLISSRRKKANRYNELLQRHLVQLSPQREPEWSKGTYQSYVVHINDSKAQRDMIIKILRDKYNIETQIGTYSLHLQPSFAKTKRIGRLRNGEFLFKNTLTLPLYHTMTDKEQEYVVQALGEALSFKPV